MSNFKQTALLAVVYSFIIFGTMAISGWVSERNLYDKYIIEFDGIILPYQHYALTVNFYKNVLNFKPLLRKDKSKAIVGFEISSKRHMYLEPANEFSSSTGQTISIKVRNGFDELHSQLVVRSEKPLTRVTKENYLSIKDKGVITRIVKRRWGREFVAYDYEGNRVIFTEYKRKNDYRNRRPLK